MHSNFNDQQLAMAHILLKIFLINSESGSEEKIVDIIKHHHSYNHGEANCAKMD